MCVCLYVHRYIERVCVCVCMYEIHRESVYVCLYVHRYIERVCV